MTQETMAWIGGVIAGLNFMCAVWNMTIIIRDKRATKSLDILYDELVKQMQMVNKDKGRE